MASTPAAKFSYPDEFLRRIPKADLHIHLDGSIRVSTLIELALEQDVSLPSYDAAELTALVFPATYSSLEDYLAGFGYITAVLRTPAALERVAYEVATDAFQIGVRYIELRFAPQLHALPGSLSVSSVLRAVDRGMLRAVREADAGDAESVTHNHGGGAGNTVTHTAPEHDYGIIACAMRFFLPSTSPYYKQLWDLHAGEDPHRVFGLASMALATAVEEVRKSGSGAFVHDDDAGDGNAASASTLTAPAGRLAVDPPEDRFTPVVALDVAGAEAGFPASDHAEAFALAHRTFLHKTVHAGEAYGPESIYTAVTELHAERIGHGLNLFNCDSIQKGGSKENQVDKQNYIDNLARYLGNMRICIEVCLSSNLQTMPELGGDIRKHPARKMIEEHMAITFCTDNTLVSHTNMARELRLAVDAFDMSPADLRNAVFCGFKRSFMPRRYGAKRDYNRRVLDYYRQIEKEFGIDS